MNDKDYTVLEVQKRDEWTNDFGTFQGYALKLEGVDGWVSLNQKPETAAPEVGGTIYGRTETQTRGGKTYLKFKKVNKEYQGGSNDSSATSATSLAGSEKTLEYVVQMLEELTGRREKADNVPSDEDVDKPIDLAEIPF